jgi:hypothetical protein
MSMRKILLLATPALFIAIGAAHANSNVPPWSPYAIMPQGGAPAAEATPKRAGRIHPSEGRAAYVYGEPRYGDYIPPDGRLYANPRDWSSIGLPVGSTGDYSNYF